MKIDVSLACLWPCVITLWEVKIIDAMSSSTINDALSMDKIVFHNKYCEESLVLTGTGTRESYLSMKINIDNFK
jgi:hypothetical protein